MKPIFERHGYKISKNNISDDYDAEKDGRKISIEGYELSRFMDYDGHSQPVIHLSPKFNSWYIGNPKHRSRLMIPLRVDVITSSDEMFNKAVDALIVYFERLFERLEQMTPEELREIRNTPSNDYNPRSLLK
jgi:hypothetical protein